MQHHGGVLTLVRKAAEKKILFLPHAVRQMSLPERMITGPEVRGVVKTGELIEDYPEDVRGHSCLVFGFGENDRPIHVVCSPKDDYLAIITAYFPHPNEWQDDFRTRKKQ